MADEFASFSDSVASPANHCWVVAPSNTDPLPYVTKAIRAVGAGTITFRAKGDSADVAHPVLDGERIDVRATHIRVTGTTGVTSIIAYA